MDSDGRRPEVRPRSIEIAGTTFDNVTYDADADVLYLHVGDPSRAVEFDASIEGHHLRFDADGALVGVTIVNAKWLLQHEGEITIPERGRYEASWQQHP